MPRAFSAALSPRHRAGETRAESWSRQCCSQSLVALWAGGHGCGEAFAQALAAAPATEGTQCALTLRGAGHDGGAGTGRLRRPCWGTSHSPVLRSSRPCHPMETGVPLRAPLEPAEPRVVSASGTLPAAPRASSIGTDFGGTSALSLPFGFCGKNDSMCCVLENIEETRMASGSVCISGKAHVLKHRGPDLINHLSLQVSAPRELGHGRGFIL